MSDKEINELFDKMFGTEMKENEPEYVTAARNLDTIDMEAAGRAVERNLGLRESENTFVDRREQKELDKYMACCEKVSK